jgi:large subunit ribosomal protein L10
LANTQKKEHLIKSIEDIYSESTSVIFAHYHGLTVNQLSNLRKSLRQNNAYFRVVKNTLSKIAAQNSKTDLSGNLVVGPIAIAYTQKDPAAVAKALVDFSKDNKALKLVGGVVDKKVFSKENIEHLATLPSLDVLRANIISIIQAPATKLTRLLVTPATQVVRVIDAYSTK